MKKFAYVLAAAWLVAACAPKEEVSSLPVPKKFTASIEQGDTRTIAYDGHICWINETELQDAISIFDHNTTNDKYLYEGETGATSGDFSPESTASSPGSLNYVYAVYPYSSYNAVLSEGVIYTFSQPIQYYYTDSFGVEGACPMAAVSESNSLQFKNLTGFLKLRLYGDGSTPIDKVEIKANNGEYITGDMLVTIAPGQEPQIETYTEENYVFSSAAVYFSGWDVSLDPSEPLDVWFCLNPGVISGGITVTVTGTNGSQFVRSSSNPLEIKRGVCKETAPLEVEFPDLIYLGKGTWTDGNLFPLFGKNDVTVECDVYESAAIAGSYVVTGFQLALAAAFYGCSEADLVDYEGEDLNWYNANIIVDATDKDAVYIADQPYGIYINATYGYAYIESEPSGTLKNGVITFPAEEVYVGLSNDGYYYGNINGTFAITLPSDVKASSAPTPKVSSHPNMVERLSGSGRSPKSLGKVNRRIR